MVGQWESPEQFIRKIREVSPSPRVILMSNLKRITFWKAWEYRAGKYYVRENQKGDIRAVQDDLVAFEMISQHFVDAEEARQKYCREM